MTEQFHDRDLQTLWQSQPHGDVSISLNQIRSRARRHEQIIARRNLREYVAAAIVAALFGRIIWVGPSDTIRVGAGLVIAAAIFVVYHLHQRGTATSLPVDLALRNALEFHRAQLERQRDLLNSVWSWYLLPLAPGMLVLLIGRALVYPERTSRIIAAGILCIAAMVAAHALNRRVAARIQQRLDRLKQDQ